MEQVKLVKNLVSLRTYDKIYIFLSWNGFSSWKIFFIRYTHFAKFDRTWISMSLLIFFINFSKFFKIFVYFTFWAIHTNSLASLKTTLKVGCSSRLYSSPSFFVSQIIVSKTLRWCQLIQFEHLSWSYLFGKRSQ